MVRYLFYTIGDLTYQSPLVEFIHKALITLSVRLLAHKDSKMFQQIFKEFKIVTLYVKSSTQNQFVLKSYRH